MSSVAQLRRSAPPPRSPERQSLALAIETRDAHHARIVSLQAALQRIGFVVEGAGIRQRSAGGD